MTEKMYYTSTIFLIILTAVVAGLLGYYTGKQNQSMPSRQIALTAPLREEKKSWGQSYNLGDAIFLTISAPEEIDSNGVAEPSEGHKLVRSRIKVDNKGQFTVDFNNIWSRLTLMTSDNKEDFHTMLTFGITEGNPDSENNVLVEPGESTEGYVVYDLAQNLQVVSIAYIGETVKVIFSK